ncbi:MAG: hypothetical protein HY897_19735 [Deltaproteobacteria bacterium]|nr:hypothetical protein [Deltaproteobacteria bacterium]
MPTSSPMVRKAYYVEPGLIRRAKKLLRLRTEAEVIRLSVERMVEMEEFWRFMDRTRGKAGPDGFRGCS